MGGVGYVESIPHVTIRNLDETSQTELQGFSHNSKERRKNGRKLSQTDLPLSYLRTFSIDKKYISQNEINQR